MLFGWFKRRRRRRLRSQPLAANWLDALARHVWQYGQLTDAQQARVREYVQVFVAEKHWEGCGGLTLTDEMRVAVAGQVAVLVLGFEPQYFDHVLSILLYPDRYVAPSRTVTPSGVVVEGPSARLGEAWYRGPVILAWPDIRSAGCGDNYGRNVVMHEFAHQLDMLNGRSTDGTPPLKSAADVRRWQDVLGRSYRQLVRDDESGRPLPLHPYATTSPTEFFAVATEAFFEIPRIMRQHLPELYAVFCDYYGQNPAAWSQAAAPPD